VSKILVCQHVAYEILGTLNPLLKGAGFRIRYVNFGRHPHAEPELDGYRGLVVLGGPMNVDEVEKHPHLLTEVKLVRDAIERGIPVLGICLGAQLIARALGGKVEPNCEKEIGWYDLATTREARGDPLLSHFAGTEKIFQWHGDTFEIPRGAIHLATSSACANQAFRYGDNVYGFQFHLEVDEPMIHRWLQVPVHRQEIESLNGRIDPDRIRDETPSHIGRLKELSERTFGAFLELFGPRRKRVALPSR
jgi:GMP synthase (glutamine-hydrolysing)